jgi:hypothetical protein
LRILRIEVVPGITGVVHDDLSCHCHTSKVSSHPALTKAHIVPIVWALMATVIEAIALA